MGGAASRTKGHNFERAVASLLRLCWFDAKRGLDQTRSGLQCDVEGTPVRWELKKRKNTHEIYSAIRQALRAREKHNDPRPVGVITSKDRGAPLVTFEIHEFIRFVNILQGQHDTTAEETVVESGPQS